jgi:hypothetical protein
MRPSPLPAAFNGEGRAGSFFGLIFLDFGLVEVSPFRIGHVGIQVKIHEARGSVDTRGEGGRNEIYFLKSPQGCNTLSEAVSQLNSHSRRKCVGI